VSICGQKSRIAAPAAAHSMPRIIGRNGVIATIEPEMSAAERAALAASIRTIKKTYEIVA
jgi:malate/lactate dehydrogenase